MDRLALWDWRAGAGHWAALGSAGLLSVWAWKAAAASAPLSAEWRIFATLWREGFLRVFFPRDEDGTRYMGVLERLKRVSELRAVLGLERFHQIDLAKQRKRNTVGWGKTAGTHHMQHLPDLVFRGRDRRIARAALQRAAQLFAEPQRCLQLHQEWDRTPIFQDLVLVGGGHSHVHVLRMLGMEPVPGVRVTLVTRDVETPYSGMLPGHIAGLYTREECHLDLNILARFARVRLVHASVEGIDLQKKRVILAGDRPPLSYDVLSINIGSAPKVQEDAGEAGVTPVKPIDGFGARWDALLRTVPSWQGERRLLVVGGGAGGFELAMSIKARLTKELAALESSAVVHVALVSRATLLPQHTSGARALARQALKQKGIELISGCDVSHAENGRLYCHDGRSLHYDDCIWCTQGSPQQWVGTCGLRVDREGFLLVDQQLRCSGNYGQDVGPVFAGGDIATVLDHPRPKAGVFAVMAGMVLWINLRATLRSEKLVTYWPQQSFLGLLNLGDGSCIASRGSLGAQGEWLWGLKDWIDRRWMWNYCQGLPEMPTAEPPASAALGSGRRSGELLSLLRKSAMRCGGCGAKVGATTLAQAMARCSSYIPRQPERGEKAQVVVGAGDDAAVVDFFHANGKISTVQSIDFFRSFVEDPFVMGQVAAFHALSDLEAMGASALSAMALAQVPFAMEEKQEEDLVQLMAGASLALKSVGCALVGGHTCEAKELGLGFAVTGTLDSISEAMKKNLLEPGESLILTKPLGTGVLFAADMRAKARGPWIAGALKRMVCSNGVAAKVLRAKGCVACTDVTGFGLIGHLLEMCSTSQVEVSVSLQKVPVYPGAVECLQMGIESSLQAANVRLRRAVIATDQVRADPAFPLLFDPQTSGGLLASVPQNRADVCVDQLRLLGMDAAVIGSVTAACTGVQLITVTE